MCKYIIFSELRQSRRLIRLKKAQKLILTVFFAFVCVVIGMFIGRLSVGPSYVLDSKENISQPNNQSPVDMQSDTGNISINTATAAQLEMLPNVGEVLAARIIEYRTQNGPFDAIEDLLLVDGIGEKRLAEIRQYITLGG